MLTKQLYLPVAIACTTKENTTTGFLKDFIYYLSEFLFIGDQ